SYTQCPLSAQNEFRVAGILACLVPPRFVAGRTFGLADDREPGVRVRLERGLARRGNGFMARRRDMALQRASARSIPYPHRRSGSRRAAPRRYGRRCALCRGRRSVVTGTWIVL